MPASQTGRQGRNVTTKRKRTQQEDSLDQENAADADRAFTGYTRAGALAYLGEQLEKDERQRQESEQLVATLTSRAGVLDRVPETLRSLCVLADEESSDGAVASAWDGIQVSLIALAGRSDDIALLDVPSIGQAVDVERDKWDTVLRQWREAPGYLQRIHGEPMDGDDGGTRIDHGVSDWLAGKTADRFQDRYDRQTIELLLRAAIIHRKARFFIRGGFDDDPGDMRLGPCFEVPRAGPVQWPPDAIDRIKSSQQRRIIGCVSLWLPSLGDTGMLSEHGVWLAYDIVPELETARVYHYIGRQPVTDETLATAFRDRQHVCQVFRDLVAQLGYFHLAQWVFKLEYPCRIEEHVVASDIEPSGPIAVHFFQALSQQDKPQVLHWASPGMTLLRSPSPDILPLLRLQQRMGLGNTFLCALKIRDKIRQEGLIM